jgi:hypothetical protein
LKRDFVLGQLPDVKAVCGKKLAPWLFFQVPVPIPVMNLSHILDHLQKDVLFRQNRVSVFANCPWLAQGLQTSFKRTLSLSRRNPTSRHRQG